MQNIGAGSSPTMALRSGLVLLARVLRLTWQTGPTHTMLLTVARWS
jgi:hypothetical protein